MAQVISPKQCTDFELTKLVSGYWDGKIPHPQASAAFAELYDRHVRALLAWLSGWAPKSDLEDILQEVFGKKVWQGLTSKVVDAEGTKEFHFRGWLFQMTRNYLVDRFRKRKPDLLGEQDLQVTSRPESPPELEIEHQEILKRCLGKLEAASAEGAAIVRGRLAGDSYTEICERTNLTSDRAQRIFHDAKQRLKDCVQSVMS